jgi:hypothetical protein
MKALIFNNTVLDVCEDEFEVHPSLVWVEAVDGCFAGWTYENGSFRAPDPLPEPTYTEKRKRMYPSITDYIDGVVKGDQAQIDKYIADCLAVKAKYPKPQE